MKKKIKKIEKEVKVLSEKHQQEIYQLRKTINENIHQIQQLNYQLQKVNK